MLGWGVGGIEAEAVMLGQPLDMTAPVLLGIKLEGALGQGVTATDLVLTLTELLRARGVVGSFVEFYGTGVGGLTLADRATISNMSPEFGATSAIFPVDDETLRYLRATGRPAEQLELVERYTKEQGLFRTGSEPEPAYSDTLTFDLGSVEPQPRRPSPAAGSGLAGERPRQLRRRLRRGPKRGQAGQRLGRDRGHHLVHQHLQPGADGGGRTARPKRRRARVWGGGRGSRRASRRDHGW